MVPITFAYSIHSANSDNDDDSNNNDNNDYRCPINEMLMLTMMKITMMKVAAKNCIQ